LGDTRPGVAVGGIIFAAGKKNAGRHTLLKICSAWHG